MPLPCLISSEKYHHRFVRFHDDQSFRRYLSPDVILLCRDVLHIDARPSAALASYRDWAGRCVWCGP